MATKIRSKPETPAISAFAALEASLDRGYLARTLSELAQVPTHVPLGDETFMEPDDPKLVHFVQRVIRPEIVRLGHHDLLDAPQNNLIVRVGRGRSGRALLIQNYTPAQHHNLMEDPFSGKISVPREHGLDEPAVWGQGVSQNKAHQAVMLTVLKALSESRVQLDGRLYWAVNNEGRSSHMCSESIIAALDQKPYFGIIQLGTGLKISLGNRGRVDVNVHIQGKATHSSQPEAGASAIDGLHELMTRLRKLSWPDEHPILGGRHAIVYKVRFWPLAPHTLPSDAYVAVDRRMLPGDDPDEATEEIRRLVSDMAPFRVTVERGHFMLPALVPADDAGVAALQDSNVAVRGRVAETVYGRGTFDAGGPCRLGIPTVMFGAGAPTRWPQDLLGPDLVLLSDVETEARVLAHFILRRLH